MGLKGISARTIKTDAQVWFDFGAGGRVTHKIASLSATAPDFKAALDAKLLLQKVSPGAFWIHVNRDKSVAVATGEQPKVWPEDEGKVSPVVIG